MSQTRQSAAAGAMGGDGRLPLNGITVHLMSDSSMNL